MNRSCAALVGVNAITSDYIMRACLSQEHDLTPLSTEHDQPDVARSGR